MEGGTVQYLLDERKVHVVDEVESCETEDCVCKYRALASNIPEIMIGVIDAARLRLGEILRACLDCVKTAPHECLPRKFFPVARSVARSVVKGGAAFPLYPATGSAA